MKVLRFAFPILALTVAFSFTACNRNNVKQVDAKEQQHADDTDRVKSESDQVTSEVDAVLSNTSMGRLAEITTGDHPCGATIDTSMILQKTITIHYDGSTLCNGYVRSGDIIIQLITGNHWHDAGSVAKITHVAYKVTRQSDNKSITFDGTKYVTNVVAFTLTNPVREFMERGNNLTLTFDDNSQRVWNLARRWNITITSFSPFGANYVIQGDSTVSGTAKAMVWGANRYGTNFINSTPVAITTTYGLNGCGFFKPTSGKWSHDLDGKGVLTATFGVDKDGNAVTSGCAYGYKLDWTGDDGSTASTVKAYH